LGVNPARIVDLSKVKVPLYVLASREDHIVPWKSAYGSKDLVGIDARFVLTASGHVAGSLILRHATSAAIG
jgi:polyhydroxyalkanoate synthase